MSTATIDNVNFRLLLKAHNGDESRARLAWEKICQLGGFGGIPFEYEGGLDTKGLRIGRDEFDNGIIHNGREVIAIAGRTFSAPLPPPSADDIKRIEDVASGDRPK